MPKSNRGRKVRDITGDQFGLLTAVGFARADGHGAWWEFECQCGAKVIRRAQQARNAVKRGSEPKCGECAPRKRSHGMSNHPAYAAWKAMIFRCTKDNHPDWRNYGARGIIVCPEWFSFHSFWADMGGAWERGLTLDRIDNDAGYCASNCRWATRRQQGRNTRANRVIKTPKGSMPVVEAAEVFGVNATCLRDRLNRGMSVEAALFEPSRYA